MITLAAWILVVMFVVMFIVPLVLYLHPRRPVTTPPQALDDVFLFDPLPPQYQLEIQRGGHWSPYCTADEASALHAIIASVPELATWLRVTRRNDGP
jgi:hypothetical protein